MAGDDDFNVWHAATAYFDVVFIANFVQFKVFGKVPIDKLDELLANIGFDVVTVRGVKPYDVPSSVVLRFLCAWG